MQDMNDSGHSLPAQDLDVTHLTIRMPAQDLDVTLPAQDLNVSVGSAPDQTVQEKILLDLNDVALNDSVDSIRLKLA